MAQLPLVVEPNCVGVNAIRSSSAAETPVTEALPRVLISSVPFESKVKASTSSSSTERPTSDPSKYHCQDPAVVLPREEGMKSRMSECIHRADACQGDCGVEAHQQRTICLELKCIHIDVG